MKQGILAWLIGLVALVAPPARAADADAVLAAAMAGTRVPAMGVVVLRDGHIAALAVQGVRDNDGHDPVRADDPWHIGSDIKAMTATLIGRLVEQRRLHWQDRVGAMLPEWANVMHPHYARATLADLLSHHAGLPHDLIDPVGRAALFDPAAPGTPREQRLRYVVRALADPPVDRDGSFHYANTGYLVAAAMAEAVTGEPYETLLQREVLAPLGIARARFGTTGAGEPRGHRDGHPTGPDDTNPPFFAPAGGLVLPLDDWARFALDQLAGARGAGRLLTPGGYHRMQTAHGDGHYGLGWEVVDEYAGHAGPALVHAGSDTNWYAMAVLFPRDGTGVLVVANAGADMGGDAADRAVLTALVPGL
ncbi:serine hydrolase domain-containing protein [Novosphingobium sp.]|uniref:serine hydrolase domain-containing protein n=1 Tax=Novosphingobium sp. TaxID=1874826 RepID=UPI003340F2F8